MPSLSAPNPTNSPGGPRAGKKRAPKPTRKGMNVYGLDGFKRELFNLDANAPLRQLQGMLERNPVINRGLVPTYAGGQVAAPSEAPALTDPQALEKLDALISLVYEWNHRTMHGRVAMKDTMALLKRLGRPATIHVREHERLMRIMKMQEAGIDPHKFVEERDAERKAKYGDRLLEAANEAQEAMWGVHPDDDEDDEPIDAAADPMARAMDEALRAFGVPQAAVTAPAAPSADVDAAYDGHDDDEEAYALDIATHTMDMTGGVGFGFGGPDDEPPQMRAEAPPPQPVFGEPDTREDDTANALHHPAVTGPAPDEHFIET